eukprot:Blabericola_migrator_1__9209@NODE_493_length_8037_cov_350_734128_g378_i0_p8_GENE_NODE_493_length_8037_cov_350_734128_g378_i0NODE_493_length_8037_cov_350_734128_g378_i0_p8_ORF_typecomplete_len162_score32_94_NODE_493_length_8037_cov_350_734128_g378_i031153600
MRSCTIIALAFVSTKAKTPLEDAYLRLSPRFWAETLFEESPHIIQEDETAEAILEAKRQKKKPDPKRFRPFTGKVDAFQLGVDDLGFVRDAFHFDQKEKENVAVALASAAARVGPADVLLQLNPANVCPYLISSLHLLVFRDSNSPRTKTLSKLRAASRSV